MNMENETVGVNSSDANDYFLFLAGTILLPFYCLIFIFGLIGNSMVIYVAIRKKSYRNVTNCHVINLAIADLLFLTLSIPYTIYLGVRNTYPFGNIACLIYTYLAYGFLQATCNILAVMSIDRYLYIVLPKPQLTWRTPRHAFIICIVVWASSLTVIIPYHIITRWLTPGYTACGMNDHENLFVCFFPFCTYYAIPLVVITVCYTKLALYVIRTGRTMADHMNTKSSHRTAQVKQRHVTKMVVVFTLAFALCWLPIHSLELMKCINSSFLAELIQSYPRALYSFRACTHALAYLNSCLNPYLYALLNRNFCMDLVDILPAWARCGQQVPTVEETHHQLGLASARTSISVNTTFFPKKDHENHIDDECAKGEYLTRQLNSDASCQMKLLRVTGDS